MGHMRWGWRMRRFALLLVVMAGVGTPVAWARFAPVVCRNAFTPEQEISEGQKVAVQVYRQMPVLPESDPVTQYVQRLGARLVAHAPGYQWPYNFHVVASADINAFAVPGGSIFVNLGTVQAAETEAQLAGVMAHEVSHVVMRHSTCNLTQQQGRSVLYGVGSVLSSVLLGNGTAGSLAQGALGIGKSLDFLHMSRDDEKQADLLGTGILYDTGYDPRGLPQFFETIQAKYGAGGAQFMSDHPNPGNRTEYVNEEIRTLPPRQGGTVTTAEFKRMHAEAMKEQTYAAKDVQAGVWKQTGHYASGPGASAGRISEAASANSGAGARPGGAGAAEGAVRLSRSALGVDSRMVKYQAPRYVVNYPASWQKSVDASGAVTFVPPGGGSAAGIAYGVLIDVEKQAGSGVSDAASLSAATAALMQRLSEQNGGLEQVSGIASTQVQGQSANAVELRGRSPVIESGAALAERNLLVTVARPDGDLNYMVFVAPEPEFAMMKPLFSAMAASFKAQ
jgi:Zn-dependent protease with chaperone function